jgi:hypothetical protein
MAQYSRGQYTSMYICIAVGLGTTPPPRFANKLFEKLKGKKASQQETTIQEIHYPNKYQY